jgi:DNA modification methylase
MAVKRKAKGDTPAVGLRIEQWPLAKLLRYANNSREHSPAQIDQIAASIKEFGFVNPCLVDAKGVLIAGHGRVAGAQKIGMKTVPAIQLGHLTDTQARALRIADNSIALNSTWNEEMLRIELTELKLADYPLELLGFDDVQLVSFMAGVGTSGDPEATPEPPTVPVSRTGDLWLLGKHRLLCGDATSKSDVAVCLGKAKPHLMVTDPPYGVEYDANWRNERFRPNGAPTDGRAIGMSVNDDQADWRGAYRLFGGDVIYAWSADLRSRQSIEAIESLNFEVRAQIIWAKQQFAIGRGDYHFQHEPCWYAVRKGGTSHWHGDRSQSTLWQIDKPHKSETGHSAQKPIECMKRPIDNNSRPGDTVYDPFVGSGTTIIAAEMTGRQCLAIEIAPQYVDVSVQRWQTYSKKSAILEATGETFAEVAAERAAEALAAE